MYTIKEMEEAVESFNQDHPESSIDIRVMSLARRNPQPVVRRMKGIVTRHPSETRISIVWNSAGKAFLYDSRCQEFDLQLEGKEIEQ